MKKALVILSLLVFSTVAWAEEVMVNSKEAKIRSGPGTTYAVIWKPHVYTPLGVLAKYDDWYAVMDVEKDVGWVNSGSVSKDHGAIVTEKIIDVHESPEPKARVIYQAPKNFTFKITEEKEGWAKVLDSDGESGWIQKKGVWTGAMTEDKTHSKEAKKEKKEGKTPKKSAKKQKHGEKKKSDD